MVKLTKDVGLQINCNKRFDGPEDYIKKKKCLGQMICKKGWIK